MKIVAKKINKNLDVDALISIALNSGEAKKANNGALVTYTGRHTGRSPKDKYIVDDNFSHDLISWGKVNRPISKDVFNKIKEEVLNYLKDKEVYEFDGFAGADKKYQKAFKVVNELAVQNLFIHQLLIRPSKEELNSFKEDYTIVVTPNLHLDKNKYAINSDAFIGIDYNLKEILIVGTAYSGEIKKAVFSTMNFIMPSLGVLPMHCSANMDPLTKKTAIFFGLSGTGKTTLSASKDRLLIGDDEHGFSDEGVFNFEGGCYAKCINLSKENEPDIYNAIKSGAVVENVIMDKDGNLDFYDDSITENTRVGYPLNYINNAVIPSVGKVPSCIIFLTCDAFGVLPPVSKLSKEGAMYHFISGFTSKVAGTEDGIKEPTPTFSTLFGEPFMPLDVSVYAKMLGEKIEKYNIDVYLVNTGYAKGKASDGASRIKLAYTRNMIKAILDGSIKNANYKYHPIFNLEYPTNIEGVPSELLDPKEYWDDKKKYDETSFALAKMFNDNFLAKYPNVSENIKKAGPIYEKR